MKDIKIRYTWKRGSDGNIIQRVVDLRSLEEKGLILDFSGYRLIARDLWTAFEDEDKAPVFNGDIIVGHTTRFTTHRYVGSNPAPRKFEGAVKYVGGGFKIMLSSQAVINRFGGSTSIYLNQAECFRVTGNVHLTK